MSATHLRSPRHAFERQQPTGSLELQEALRQENEQLRTALATRIVIEQAKGTRAERFEMHVNEAFERLRHQARSHQVKLHVLAAAVTAREAWAEAIFPPAEPRNAPAARSSAREASPTLAPRPQALRLRAEALRVTQSTDRPLRRPRTRHATEGEQ
jgi:ANTAR domain